MQVGCPKRYRAEFIEPGIISYEDVGQGKVFVPRSTLDRMRNSFIGKPVVLLHQDLSFEAAFKLTDEEKESLADGIVFNCGSLGNGWDYCDFIVWNLNTQEKLDRQKYNISCAYQPTEVEPSGGKWHNIEYDEEVKNGVYTHMAVVPNPRYEGAKVYELPKEYHNALSNGLIQEYTKLIKEKKNMKLFQIFMPKKNEAAEKKDEKKEEVEKLNAEETMIEIDGQQIPLSEIIKAYQAEKAEEAVKGNSGDAEKIPLKAEDEIDIDGKKEKVGDIINCYKNRMKKNAEPPIDTKAESVVDEAAQKQNAINSANFKKLQNAVAKAGSEFKISVLTREERIASGKSKYGGKI